MINQDERENRYSSLVDSLLEGYSQVDPRAGLEIRILARLRLRMARQRLLRVSLIAASVAVVVFVALNTTRSQKPQFDPPIASRRAVQPAPLTPDTVRAARPRIASSKLITNRQPGRGDRNTLILLLARSIEGGNGSVFQQKSTDVDANRPAEEDVSPEWQTSVSGISTQNSALPPEEPKEQVVHGSTD